MAEKKKKITKTIKIDVDKCNDCQACEAVCSAFHATPKYSSINPARSRIRVIREPLKDIYVPVYAGDIPKPNVPAERRIRLTERNTPSVAYAGFPARPGIFSKNPIPVSLSNAICVKVKKGALCVFSGV